MLYEKKPVAVCVSRCCQKQTFSTVLVASAVIAIAAPAHAQPTGMVLCDDFLAMYEACLSLKLPFENQSRLKAVFAKTRKAWSNLAKDADAKSSLEDFCENGLNTYLVSCNER